MEACSLFMTQSMKLLDAIQNFSSGEFILKITPILHLLLINNLGKILVFFSGQMFKLWQSV